jgi:hypothetical protein
MRPFVAVLQREIAEHRMFLAAGVLVGLMPLALPLIPGTQGTPPAELRAGAAAILAALLGITVAIIVGGSALTRDLAERRLGFYFSRPISGLSIWGGKMAAAVLVTLSTSLLVLLPALLLGDLTGSVPLPLKEGLLSEVDRLKVLAFGAVALLLLLGLSHVFATQMRSRTPWLLLDLVAATVITGLVMLGWNQLSAANAQYIALPLVPGLVLALAVGLIAGSLIQVLRGRTDLHASHRWLSLTLWTLLGLSTLGLTGYLQWILGAEPEDLAGIGEEQVSPTGSWIFIQGVARHRLGYRPGFLYDTASGRYVRVRPSRFGWETAPQPFSENGAWAAWLEYRTGGPHVLVRADLRGSRPRVYRDPVILGNGARLALSPNGSRLAVFDFDRIQIQDTTTGKLLISAPAPMLLSGDEHLYFSDNQHLRCIGKPRHDNAGALAMLELDLATGKVSSGTLMAHVALWSSILSPGRDLLLARDYDAIRQYRLVNVKTGKDLGVLPTFARTPSEEGTHFLQDGRLLLSHGGSKRCGLRLFAAGTTREIRRFSWAGFDSLWIGGQPTPNHLVVTLYNYEHPEFQHWDPRAGRSRIRSILLDLDTGATRNLPPETLPLGGPGDTPGSLGTLLFQGREGITRLDPATLKQTPVLKFG